MRNNRRSSRYPGCWSMYREFLSSFDRLFIQNTLIVVVDGKTKELGD